MIIKHGGRIIDTKHVKKIDIHMSECDEMESVIIFDFGLYENRAGNYSGTTGLSFKKPEQCSLVYKNIVDCYRSEILFLDVDEVLNGSFKK